MLVGDAGAFLLRVHTLLDHTDRLIYLMHSYRCFMTVCTALVEQTQQPSFKSLLFSRIQAPGSVGVRSLQRLLENSWEAGKSCYGVNIHVSSDLSIGFDAQGADQLRPIVGKSKWIGTAGIYPLSQL